MQKPTLDHEVARARALVRLAPLTARKFRELSFASALAISVLEQPGGPYSKIPFGGRMPMRIKASGCCSGTEKWFNWYELAVR